MKWLVTGASGMLGTDLVELLRSAGHEVMAPSEQALDVTSAPAVESAVADVDVVVNAAAWTAVDDAEEHEATATQVNGEGPRLLARAAARRNARLVQVSTDYVFDGEARTPYAEDADTNPTSVYGRSKAMGEKAVREELPDAHLIVRSAWLYGAHGSCFPRTIARLARERGQIDVVDDQVGQPTWTRDLAQVMLRLVTDAAPAGTYHATSSGSCSWFDFAQRVVVAAGHESSVVQRASSAAVARPAPRPAYSVLGHEALRRVGIEPIGDWESRWAAAAPEVLEGT